MAPRTLDASGVRNPLRVEVCSVARKIGQLCRRSGENGDLARRLRVTLDLWVQLKPKTDNGNREAISLERKAEAQAPDSVALEFLRRWVDRVVDAERTDWEIVPNTASDP